MEPKLSTHFALPKDYYYPWNVFLVAAKRPLFIIHVLCAQAV